MHKYIFANHLYTGKDREGPKAGAGTEVARKIDGAAGGRGNEEEERRAEQGEDPKFDEATTATSAGTDTGTGT